MRYRASHVVYEAKGALGCATETQPGHLSEGTLFSEPLRKEELSADISRLSALTTSFKHAVHLTPHMSQLVTKDTQVCIKKLIQELKMFLLKKINKNKHTHTCNPTMTDRGNNFFLVNQ